MKPQKKDVTAAFEYRVQGFFTKPDTLEQQADLLEEIIKYWISSKHPNKEFLKTAYEEIQPERSSSLFISLK